MKKSTRNIVLLLLAIAAGTLIIVFDNMLIGGIIAGWAILYWGWSIDANQEVTADARELNPKDVKEYRRQHPDATIVDAVNALGRTK